MEKHLTLAGGSYPSRIRTVGRTAAVVEQNPEFPFCCRQDSPPMFRHSAPILAAVAFSVLGGCAHQQEEKDKLDQIRAEGNRRDRDGQTDKTLAAGLYRLSPDAKDVLLPAGLEQSGYSLGQVTTDGLHYRHRWINQAPDWTVAREKMRSGAHPLLDDPIAAKYVEVVRARGDIARLYKPTMGGQLNSMFKLFHAVDTGKNTQEWYGIDNALIEYTPDGHVVSALTKSQQGVSTKDGVSIDEYVHVFYGPAIARYLENNVPGTRLVNDFEHDVDGPQAALPAAPAVPVAAAPVAAAPSPAGRAPAKVAANSAAPACQPGQRLVRTVGVKAVDGAVQVDVVDMKTGQPDSSNLPLEAAMKQQPKVGQLKCWASAGAARN
jgi:hypothetical protein